MQYTENLFHLAVFTGDPAHANWCSWEKVLKSWFCMSPLLVLWYGPGPDCRDTSLNFKWQSCYAAQETLKLICRGIGLELLIPWPLSAEIIGMCQHSQQLLFCFLFFREILVQLQTCSGVSFSVLYCWAAPHSHLCSFFCCGFPLTIESIILYLHVSCLKSMLEQLIKYSPSFPTTDSTTKNAFEFCFLVYSLHLWTYLNEVENDLSLLQACVQFLSHCFIYTWFFEVR